MSIGTGGVGLNIVSANRVVFLDVWWNPFVHEQCEDRTYRIGQQKQVMARARVRVRVRVGVRVRAQLGDQRREAAAMHLGRGRGRGRGRGSHLPYISPISPVHLPARLFEPVMVEMQLLALTLTLTLALTLTRAHARRLRVRRSDDAADPPLPWLR